MYIYTLKIILYRIFDPSVKGKSLQCIGALYRNNVFFTAPKKSPTYGVVSILCFGTSDEQIQQVIFPSLELIRQQLKKT